MKAQKMKRIVEGKVYDTETAEEIATYEPFSDRTKFQWWSETLYRTKKGRYFKYGIGGPMSKYAETFPGGATGGEVIVPLTDKEAFEWLASYFPEKAIELFPEQVEEA